LIISIIIRILPPTEAQKQTSSSPYNYSNQTLPSLINITRNKISYLYSGYSNQPLHSLPVAEAPKETVHSQMGSMEAEKGDPQITPLSIPSRILHTESWIPNHIQIP
jgi:hypothetical protein